MSMSEEDLGLIAAGFSAMLGFQVVPPQTRGQQSVVQMESATSTVLPKVSVHELFHTTHQPFYPVLPQQLSSLFRLESSSADTDLFDINVKIINGQTTTVRARKGQTVKDIKASIESQLDIPFKDQTLTLFGQPLSDLQPISMLAPPQPPTQQLGGGIQPMMCCNCVGGKGPYELDCSDLDPHYNHDFTNEKDDGQEYVRGGKVYTRPYGWKRFAVKVLGRYDDDADGKNTWLGTDGIRTNESKGEWPVAYHGTNREAAEKIIETGYKIGQGDMYGPGVYTSPSIKWFEEKSNQYAIKFEYPKGSGQWWKVVLQNRVNSDRGHLKIIKKSWARVPFWISPLQDITKNVFDVRPYGILFIKV